MTRPILTGIATILCGVGACGALVSRADDCSSELACVKKAVERRGGRLICSPANTGATDDDSEECPKSAAHTWTAEFIHCDDLNGEDIARLGAVCPLTRLDLRLSRVSPDVLLAVTRLPWLQDLDLSSTLITDADLPTMAAAPSLIRLRLNNTKVTAAGLAAFPQRVGGHPVYFDLAGLHWCEPAKLRGLNLKAFNLSGETVPKGWLANLPGTLEELYLADSGLTDVDLPVIGNLTNLTFLDLSKNGVTDKGLSHLSRLTSLQSLLLNSQNAPKKPGSSAEKPGEGTVTDESDEWITDWSFGDKGGLRTLTKLTKLDLTHALVTDAGVAQILRRNPSLDTLILVQNPVNGIFNVKSERVKNGNYAINLHKLDVSDTLVGEQGLADIGDITSLAKLDLRTLSLDDETFLAGFQKTSADFHPIIDPSGTKVTDAALMLLQLRHIQYRRFENNYRVFWGAEPRPASPPRVQFKFGRQSTVR